MINLLNFMLSRKIPQRKERKKKMNSKMKKKAKMKVTRNLRQMIWKKKLMMKKISME